MTRRFEAINPFYPLLVLAGVAFAITALAYGIMALKALTPGGAQSEHPLLIFLDRHGMVLMAVELGLLAASSLLAMATDGFCAGRAANTAKPNLPPGFPASSLDDRSSGP